LNKGKIDELLENKNRRTYEDFEKQYGRIEKLHSDSFILSQKDIGYESEISSDTDYDMVK
jgi:hypothetical protein